MLPRFKAVVQHCSKQTLRFIIADIVIVNYVFLVIESICIIQFVRQLSVTNIYVAYFLCGGYISRYAKETENSKKVCTTFVLIGLAASLIAPLKGFDNIGLNGYILLPVFCSSISIFLLFNYMKTSVNYEIIAKFSKLIFGVCLIHRIALNVLVKLLKTHYYSSDIWLSAASIFVVCCFVYVISMIASRFLNMLPSVKRIV